MIFDRDKKYNTFYNEIIIHVIVFVSISLNIFSSSSIVDFTQLTCLVIYLSKGSKVKWHYLLLIFLWGIYSDLITGYPVGYSSSIFLFFLLLNQISNLVGVFFVDKIRLLIFFSGLLLVSSLEHLTIYLQFKTNIQISLQILEILFILILYYPINYLIKKNLNLYASKE
tara:strand:+ start:546 stop:1052 length:507 start_codon:yes stop_codon:yes gene_type:complete